MKYVVMPNLINFGPLLLELWHGVLNQVRHRVPVMPPRVWGVTSSIIISRKALVSWDTICKPLSAGGFNVINLYIWNEQSSHVKAPLGHS